MDTDKGARNSEARACLLGRVVCVVRVCVYLGRPGVDLYDVTTFGSIYLSEVNQDVKKKAEVR